MGYKDMEEGLNDWHDGVLGAVLEEDRLILQEAYRKLREIGDRQDQEYRVRWKDGSIHWLEGTSMVVGVTPQGEDILQRTAVDVTQRQDSSGTAGAGAGDVPGFHGGQFSRHV